MLKKRIPQTKPLTCQWKRTIQISVHREKQIRFFYPRQFPKQFRQSIGIKRANVLDRRGIHKTPIHEVRLIMTFSLNNSQSSAKGFMKTKSILQATTKDAGNGEEGSGTSMSAKSNAAAI